MTANQCHELLHILCARRERGDEAHQHLVGRGGGTARQTAGRPWMIGGAGGSQPPVELAREFHEHLVRLERPHRRESSGGQSLGQKIRHGVGVAREREPEVVRQIRLELRGDEAVLGEQMSAALAPLRHAGGARRIEEHDRLGRERAALGGPEREHVDAELPARVCGRKLLARERVGEPRAVDVEPQVLRMGELGERADFLRRIDRSGLGRLGEREPRRNHVMRTAARQPLQRGLECRR